MPGPPSSYFKPPSGQPKPTSILLRQLAQNWWALMLRGILAVGAGLLAFAWPKVSVVMLLLLFGAYATVDGLLTRVMAFAGDVMVPRWWLLCMGFAGLATGALTMLLPGFTALVLLTLIGAWAIVRGVLEIVGAIQLRKEIEREWFLVLCGLLSVAFGAFVLIFPGAGALALLWLIASYAIVLGSMFIGLALRLRPHRRKPTAA